MFSVTHGVSLAYRHSANLYPLMVRKKGNYECKYVAYKTRLN